MYATLFPILVFPCPWGACPLLWFPLKGGGPFYGQNFAQRNTYMHTLSYDSNCNHCKIAPTNPNMFKCNLHSTGVSSLFVV